MLKRYKYFLFTFFIGSWLSLLVNQYEVSKHNEADNQRFIEYSEKQLKSLNRALESNWEILISLTKTFQVRGDITRKEFEYLTRHFLLKHKEFKALSWIPKVAFSHKQLYEDIAQESGLAEFKIKEKNLDNVFINVTERDYYYPVYYVEPIEDNKTAIGFDLGSNKTRLDSLMIAAEKNKITVTAPIKLVQEKDNKIAILALSPVYKISSDPELSYPKLENITGYISMVLVLQEFYDFAIPKYNYNNGINIKIEDQITGQYLAGTTTQTDNNVKSYYSYEAKMETGFSLDPSAKSEGRAWLFTANAKRHFHENSNIFKLNIYLISGMIISLLVALSIQKQVNNSLSIQDKVTEKTKKLNEANAINTSILDTAVDAIISINEKGIISRFNQAAELLLGFDKSEAIGQNVKILMPPQFAEHHDTFLSDYMETGVEHIIGKTTPTFAQHKDGSQIHISLAVSDTGISGDYRFTGIMHDQSETVAVQKELSEQRHALNQHAIVGITDVKGTIQFANDKFCEISGYSKAELIGNNHRLINSGEKTKDYWKAMYQTISSGNVWHDEIKNINKNGEYYWVDTTIVPVMGINRKPESYISIRTDITERVEIENTLQGHYAVLEQTVAERTMELQLSLEKEAFANKEKSRFLANMSHELRTPMHAILSFTDLTIKREDDEKKLKFLNNIKASGLRLTGLLDNLLDLAKLEAGKMITDFVTGDLTLTAQMCITELQGLAEKKNINIVLESSKVVIGAYDNSLIRQVIVNLLSNALKFSPEGGNIECHTLEMKRSLHDEIQDVIEFSVTDHGIGIPEDDLEIVFDKFIQSSKTTSKAGGTGLGLAICHEIIEAHHGKIWAVSPLEDCTQGTTFHFIIPINKPKTPLTS